LFHSILHVIVFIISLTEVIKSTAHGTHSKKSRHSRCKIKQDSVQLPTSADNVALPTSAAACRAAAQLLLSAGATADRRDSRTNITHCAGNANDGVETEQVATKMSLKVLFIFRLKARHTLTVVRMD